MSDQPVEVTNAKSNVKKRGGRAITALPAAAAQPIASAGRQVHWHVTGGLQWYLEKWEDVVVEVRAERAGTESVPDVATVLASLAQAKVLSECPGRVRWRANQLKGQHALAYDTVEALAKIPGIRRVEASPVTGTILMTFDSRTYPSLDALRQTLGQR